MIRYASKDGDLWFLFDDGPTPRSGVGLDGRFAAVPNQNTKHHSETLPKKTQKLSPIFIYLPYFVPIIPSIAPLATFCYYLKDIMEFLRSVVLPVLPYIQIILSILLVAAILLQQRGSSLGGAFGGDNFSSAFHKRRGSELFLFRIAVVLAVLFVLSALLNIVL